MGSWHTIYLVGVALLSLAGLSLFAGKFVRNAAQVAKSLHVNPVIVGVVLLGFGTSLPELFVSGQAVLSGQPELAVGNIVGSNTVNLSIVLGVGALFTTLYVSGTVVRREALFGLLSTVLYMVGGVSILLGNGPSLNWWVVTIPVVVAAIAWVVAARGLKIVRWEGAVLIALGCAATGALLVT